MKESPVGTEDEHGAVWCSFKLRIEHGTAEDSLRHAYDAQGPMIRYPGPIRDPQVAIHIVAASIQSREP